MGCVYIARAIATVEDTEVTSLLFFSRDFRHLRDDSEGK